MLLCNSGSVQKMITRSETSTTHGQSGSAMNRSGSAAQSGSAMNQSGLLRTYLIKEYGEQTQRLVNHHGRELNRQARFANHHHFILRCVKSGIVPSSLCFPSRRIRYGFQQSRRVSPGFITWLQFVFFLFFLLRKPSKIWCETSKIKNSETGELGTRKQIGTGECCCVTRVQFRRWLPGQKHRRPMASPAQQWTSQGC